MLILFLRMYFKKNYIYFCFIFYRQALLKEKQAREQAEKEKNQLLVRILKLEEEANKAKDGKTC
jgi:hypothetical protein